MEKTLLAIALMETVTLILEVFVLAWQHSTYKQISMTAKNVYLVAESLIGKSDDESQKY